MSEITIAKRTFTIQHIHDGAELFRILSQEKPKIMTYDTETTGLHVKADKPFKGAVCFKNKVYLFNTTYDILHWFPRWAKETKVMIGHNMGFDLNMTANIIGEDFLKDKDIRYMDTMNLVSLVTETQSERNGGVSLKLKQLATKFIDVNANQWELALKKWMSEEKARQNKMLTAYIKDVVIPNQEVKLGKNGKPLKPARYTRKQFDSFEVLPPELQEVYDLWKEEEYKEVTYNDVPPEILDPYLAADVVLTLLLAEDCLPIIKERGQEDAARIESLIIPPVVRMARVGMEVDHRYLEDSKVKLENWIKEMYEQLWNLTEPLGFKFSSGQHATIKKYYEAKGIVLESSDSDHLEKVGDTEAHLISKLRTAEKWLSTYIVKIQRDSAYDGRFYSLLNPFKAVTGRFSGDCQQFPKFPLYNDNGEEVYFPRRAFKGEWVFADFSQQELRVATHYAIQLGVEDYNLFRAYMPYKCTHYITGKVYVKQEDDWDERQSDGRSAWLTETKEPWVQTDLHSSTAEQTIHLLGLSIKRTDPEFKKWRQMAKTTNFGKLYGATWKALIRNLGVDETTARALDDGYYKAFPSLKVYAEKINRQMNKRGFVNNLYNRKYYMTEPSLFYQAGNYIIQGSCAYDVKAKIIQIQDYLDSVNAKTQMVITIHDEICYTWVEGEEHILDRCIEIMENSDNMLVPLVSEREYTKTKWADKK